jgi:Flp pilus assembly pilin Flp
MTLRSRLPEPEPEHSLADTIEYGLTAVLVIVVVIALLQIFGVQSA